MPLISVIVPVYKVEKYIHRCVDSILAQSFTDFELILVDDESPDNCGIICDEYAKIDPRVNVIHKKNGGHSDARNAGIDWSFEYSDSKWITFVDSDDYIHQDYLLVLLNLCNNYKVDVSSCGCVLFEDEQTIEAVDHDDIDSEYGYVKDMVLKYKDFSKFNTSVIWGRMYKKELFDDVRFPIGRFFEDDFVIYRILFNSEIIAITTSGLYYYYQNVNGVMASGLPPKRMNDQLDALAEQVEYFLTQEYFELFENKFYFYCSLVEKYLQEYKGVEEYTQHLNSHKDNISHFLKVHKEHMPQLLQKYGYKKGLSCKALMCEGLKKDLSSVRTDKGVFYSTLWFVKNFGRYKNQYRMNPIISDNDE